MPMILLILSILTGSTFDKVPAVVIRGNDCPDNIAMRLYSREDCPARYRTIEEYRAGRGAWNLSPTCLDQLRAGLDAYCDEDKAATIPLTSWLE